MEVKKTEKWQMASEIKNEHQGPVLSCGESNAPDGLALIRACDICKTVTAIDLDSTPEHWQQMCMHGQTIIAVTQDEAGRLWRKAGRCECAGGM